MRPDVGRPPHRARIDPAVAQRFPGYVALVVYAFDLTNGPSDGRSLEWLREAERLQRARLAGSRAAEHPHLAAWREAYRGFGLKPGRSLNSAEALLSRVLKGEDLPGINRLVDLYNAVSVKHAIPAGGEDLERLAGDPTLRFATGDEPFDLVRDGQVVSVPPEPGEVVWADPAGVTCRAWNWRQCLRTRLTEGSRHAYFILDRLEPLPLESLGAAGDELVARLRAVSPGCTLERRLLGAGAG